MKRTRVAIVSTIILSASLMSGGCTPSVSQIPQLTELVEPTSQTTPLRMISQEARQVVANHPTEESAKGVITGCERNMSVPEAVDEAMKGLSNLSNTDHSRLVRDLVEDTFRQGGDPYEWFRNQNGFDACRSLSYLEYTYHSAPGNGDPSLSYADGYSLLFIYHYGKFVGTLGWQKRPELDAFEPAQYDNDDSLLALSLFRDPRYVEEYCKIDIERCETEAEEFYWDVYLTWDDAWGVYAAVYEGGTATFAGSDEVCIGAFRDSCSDDSLPLRYNVWSPTHSEDADPTKLYCSNESVETSLAPTADAIDLSGQGSLPANAWFLCKFEDADVMDYSIINRLFINILAESTDGVKSLLVDPRQDVDFGSLENDVAGVSIEAYRVNDVKVKNERISQHAGEYGDYLGFDNTDGSRYVAGHYVLLLDIPEGGKLVYKYDLYAAIVGTAENSRVADYVLRGSFTED